jgi:hypothetical protein
MMTPPLIVVRACAGPISRRLGRVVVEVDHCPQPIPWGMAVEIAVDSGTREVIAYLVLLDTPWPLARRLTAARARLEIADGDQRRLEYRPSHLCSGAYHGRLRVIEAAQRDPAPAPTDSG